MTYTLASPPDENEKESGLRTANRVRAAAALPGIALLLLWFGFFGPWVQHDTAALTIIGFDLAEWITFLPGVRDGSLPFGRLHFLAPFACALVLTALLGWRIAAGRWALVGAAAAGALLLLPGYPFILFWRDDPAVRSQIGLVVAVWVGVFGTGLLSRRWDFGPSLAALIVSTAGLYLSTATFLSVRPAIAELYGAMPAIGWGWAAMEVGFGLVVAHSSHGLIRALKRETC